MPLYTVDVGLTNELDAMLAAVQPWFHLYTFPVTAAPGLTVADFTEADWPDYAPVRVTSWAPSLIITGQAQTNGDPVKWVRGAGGAPQDVYGYYVTRGKTGVLLWFERRPAGPVPMSIPTDSVLVIPGKTLARVIS